ncbi:MAG: STAS domain-containing protein [Gloeobacteraceae cyanobacterium ES-bin-144]|nr:STAS domain-containing protein [Verrucomicrobiales bacterium]
MKTFGDHRIANGENLLVVDLGSCTGMDSTFMGTLAGMAARLTASDGGKLQIADPSERNRHSLEDLGLDFLMEIDPPSAAWRENLNAIRSKLAPPLAPGSLGKIQRTKHVLEAHQQLSGINDKNAREFSNVVETMENELSEKEKLAEKSKPG